ncbi:sigma-70 family RNA polymerase sigma factor [Jiangella anatolica]|uniref:SigE family RNA polymerase sigma factor n=1 Tax=Jiangella anatolica TaxID=2670374 RepID=A0A2W2BUA7_9ACTN|nr:sigma-70 family RNA polymerase sigma factor [Jiangella anatolica]PZF83618.1 SigE family RNA polymerase sigma factor [Jiangella anatolica]
MQDDFADWYSALWPRVLRVVTVAVGDRDLAEEATAEAFARALARWPATAEVTSPIAWLQTVAINHVRSRWRRGRLERRALERMAGQPQRHPDAPEPRNDALWDAVAALPSRTRHIVALRYIADLPEAEIAVTLGITRGTVASTLSRARQQLGSVLSSPTATSEEIS